MKKLSLIIPITAICLMATTISYSQTYTTTQISNTGFHYNGAQQINANGHVVWEGIGGLAGMEIFLYDGSVTTQITDDDVWDRYPQINDNGLVVWERYDGSDNEIFLYNGSTITQITDNDFNDTNPQINTNGHVVWNGYDGSDNEIFLYDGSTTTQITNNNFHDTDPQINANGHVVWHGYDGSDIEIFLYDGVNTIQITDNNYDDTNPQINTNGQVVWKESNGSDHFLGISLYDGSTITRIKDYSFFNLIHNQVSPQINVNGQIVWAEPNPLGYFKSEILLYNGPTITQIVNRDYSDTHPQINDNGQVVWYGVGQYDSISNGIFFYDGLTTTPIASNISFPDEPPQLNASGYIVWQGDTLDEEIGIFLAKPEVSEVGITDIIIFFDQSVANETLQGNGSGNSAEERLNALRNMLLKAEKLIDEGNIDAACGQLNAAYKKTDGKSQDFVSGSATDDLAALILKLQKSLGCQCETRGQSLIPLPVRLNLPISISCIFTSWLCH